MTTVSSVKYDVNDGLPLGLAEDLDRAFPVGDSLVDRGVRLSLIYRLHNYYDAYMRGPELFDTIPHLNLDPEIRAIEARWLAWEDRQLADQELPASGKEFLTWFDQVAEQHVQQDFCRYLAEEATLPELALFFLAEELVDGKFDDVMALVQTGTKGITKMTIAENYWDEMGEGDHAKVHTTLFDHSARYMRAELAKSGMEESAMVCPEVYENAALLLMYGIHRRLNPRALGAMGVLEQSASPRFQAMVDACLRLGIPEDVIEYQRIHVHVDADHGAEWIEGVFTPLVHQSQRLRDEIARGVLTRVRVADAYYEQVWSRMRAVSGAEAS
jgi:Iron-containing redox enzyme